MTTHVTTAVFPVAGLGTRFLPVTKSGPKEMLPIVDKPLIQYVVEEALQAGITQLVFVTSNTKRSLEDYFDSNLELEAHLESKGKLRVLNAVRNILPEKVTCVYVRQPRPLGLGDAVLRARSVVGHQPFAVLLADDIVDSEQGSDLKNMVDIYEETHASVLGVEKIAPEDTEKYGIISLTGERHGLAERMNGIVEKPKPSDAPSLLGAAGRYVFTPKIFDFLENQQAGVGGEIQLTDAIAALLQHETVYAYPLQNERFDCGTKIGFLKATLRYALKREELSQELLTYLHELVETTPAVL
ncbi:MAG TPA: UTP--glucose-1-phosphate uridylyltransferase GalU [Coxiellaceae bacterium]|nr:UTP--glucose-1-phosphate uridylyltransferase GalU [Coxiellaceae bacterium]